GARYDHSDNRVAGFVIGRPLPLVLRHDDLPCSPEHDLFERFGEVPHLAVGATASCRQERGFVDGVLRGGADHPRSRRSARWGGTMAGVEAAIEARSTSGASGTPRACTPRIASRPR